MAGSGRNTEYWGSRCLSGSHASEPCGNDVAAAESASPQPGQASAQGDGSEGQDPSTRAGGQTPFSRQAPFGKQHPFGRQAPFGQQNAYGQQASNAPGNAHEKRAPYGAGQQQRPAYRTGKDHVAAGLLAIFLGGLGIHKFYLGYNSVGFLMLGVTILGSIFTIGLAGLVMEVIGIVEGVIYLTKDQQSFDWTYVYNMKEWF